MVKLKSDDRVPFLLPKSYEEHSTRVPSVLQLHSKKCDVQVLRSASAWSVGIKKVEDSIRQAMIHMIRSAQQYVYIEVRYRKDEGVPAV